MTIFNWRKAFWVFNLRQLSFSVKNALSILIYFERKKNRRAPQFWKKGKPYPPRHRPLCAMSIYFKMMCARQKLRQTRVWTLAASGDRRPTDAEWASSLHLFIFPWKRNIFQELLVDMYVSICIYVPNWWFFNFCMYFLYLFASWFLYLLYIAHVWQNIHN